MLYIIITLWNMIFTLAVMMFGSDDVTLYFYHLSLNSFVNVFFLTFDISFICQNVRRKSLRLLQLWHYTEPKVFSEKVWKSMAVWLSYPTGTEESIEEHLSHRLWCNYFWHNGTSKTVLWWRWFKDAMMQGIKLANRMVAQSCQKRSIQEWHMGRQ